ncbi:hypothetical protein, partial [Gluconobacter cerinus]
PPQDEQEKLVFVVLDARTISLNQVNIFRVILLYSLDIIAVIYYTFHRSKVTDVREDIPPWLTRTRPSR